MAFNKYVPWNNAQSQLLGGISAAAVTFIVEAWEGGRFPTTFPFLVEIKNNDPVTPFSVLKREILKVTNRVWDTFTATRSAGTCLPNDTSSTPGTTAYAFSSGDTVTLTVTAETIKDIQDEVTRLETDKLNKAWWLRTWLTASGVMGTDWSWNETVIIWAWFIPTWSIVPYAASSAPTWYLLCDGTAVSRSTYSALFTLIGTTYGVWNGTTTFNIPNLKGRTPVGRDSGQTEFDVLGETWGAKTHTLSISEMPAHDHAGTYYSSNYTSPSSTFPATALNTSATASSVPSQGWWAAHNNLQPYIVVNYIIKT